MSLTKKIKNTFTKGKFKDDVEYTGTDPKAIEELAERLDKIRRHLNESCSIGGQFVKFDDNECNKEEFYKNNYIHQGPAFGQVDEQFKYYVINGVTNKGGIFGGFRNWSKGIHSKLKSIVSKSRSQIAKIEKMDYAEQYNEYWHEFYKVELEVLKKLQEVFNPNNAFNKKYLNNKKSRLSDSQVEETLEELYTIIGKQIVDVENEKEQFVEAIAATSN